VRKVMGYMGHANIQTTMRYLHHVPKHTDAGALNRLVRASSASSRAVPSAA
jgi:hypothetical protein